MSYSLFPLALPLLLAGLAVITVALVSLAAPALRRVAARVAGWPPARRLAEVVSYLRSLSHLSRLRRHGRPAYYLVRSGARVIARCATLRAAVRASQGGRYEVCACYPLPADTPPGGLPLPTIPGVAPYRGLIADLGEVMGAQALQAALEAPLPPAKLRQRRASTSPSPAPANAPKRPRSRRLPTPQSTLPLDEAGSAWAHGYALSAPVTTRDLR